MLSRLCATLSENSGRAPWNPEPGRQLIASPPNRMPRKRYAVLPGVCPGMRNANTVSPPNANAESDANVARAGSPGFGRGYSFSSSPIFVAQPE